MNATFQYEKDADGIVTLTMDLPGPVNCMNADYRSAMHAAASRLEQEPGITGVIITSAKSTFFAGGDLKELLAFQPGDEPAFMAMITQLKTDLRRLEKLPVPVVAAINGAALGGGLELCLACNHRIAADDVSVQLGLPEVTLGLLPGAGGIVRTVNLLGLEKALPYLLEGTKLSAQAALAAGLIHEVVPAGDLLPRAKAWLTAQKGNPAAAMQPWDQKGHKIPGGRAGTPALAQLIAVAPAMLRKKTRGLLPAPERILDCAIEAARLNLDTALTIESRGLTWLVGTPQAKNLITTFFFQMNALKAGGSRPKGIPGQPVRKVGILGAGMMGQGIAYASAIAGIQVVLKDVSTEAAARGKGHTERLLAGQVAKGRMDAARMQAVLDLIHPTGDDASLDGCDLIIEAVFEDLALKHQVTRQTEGFLSTGGIYATNTSSLPITRLAEAAQAPERFIGIHFFSPVDRMPLVEIICGEKTSSETLARAYDYAVQIRKTPIVVNDSLAFFTSRTFSTYLDEGARLLHEGIHPLEIDAAGKSIGMPVGPLAVHDEVSLELNRKITATWDEMGLAGKFGEQRILIGIINTLIGEYGRGGRHYGGGFYDYAEDGSKQIWPGLLALYYRPEAAIESRDMKDRLLFRQVIESLKCLQEGVLRSVADGNIGSILGIGAPTWTGGFIQFVNTYGSRRFVNRCRELASRYGDRFEPPLIAIEKADSGELFT